MFSCKVCSKEFKFHSGLSRHQKRAHSKEVVNFLCSECYRHYTRREDLVHHMAKTGHVGAPIRKKICLESSSETAEPSELLQHSSETDIPLETTAGTSLRNEEVQTTSNRQHVDADDISYLGEERENFVTDSMPETWPVRNFYTLKPIMKHYSRRYKTTVTDYLLKLNENFGGKNFPDSFRKFHAVLDSALKHMKDAAPACARGRFVLRAPGLERAIQTRYADMCDLDATALMNQVVKTLNSNEHVELNQEMQVNFLHTEMPRGAGSDLGSCRRRKIADVKKWATKKKSLIDVAKNASDKMCLARVLVAGHFYVTKIRECGRPRGSLTSADLKVWKKLREGWPKGGLQRDCAMQLCKQAGVNPMNGAGLEEVALFQQQLTEHQIVIYGTDDTGPIYVDTAKNGSIPIYVFYLDAHYLLITSLSGFLGTKKACHVCHRGYSPSPNSLNDAHKCEAAICRLCQNPKCQNDETAVLGQFDITCDDCNITFPSERCRDAHKPEQCERFCLCSVCKKAIKRTKLDDHHCMLVQCFSCKDWKEPDHLCYIQRPRKKKCGVRRVVRDASTANTCDPERAAYFSGMNEALLEYLGEDLGPPSDESDAEDLVEGSRCPQRLNNVSEENLRNETKIRIYADFESEFVESEKHNPTLLVMQDVDGQETRFRGSDCAKDFLFHLVENKKYWKSTVIFHGFGNYDGFLILEAMHQLGKPPKQIIY